MESHTRWCRSLTQKGRQRASPSDHLSAPKNQDGLSLTHSHMKEGRRAQGQEDPTSKTSTSCYPPAWGHPSAGAISPFKFNCLSVFTEERPEACWSTPHQSPSPRRPWLGTSCLLRDNREEQRLASCELRLSWGLGSTPRTFTVGLGSPRSPL